MPVTMNDVEKEQEDSAFEALSNVHVLGVAVCQRVYTANPKINNPNLMATVKALDKAVRIACAAIIHLRKRVIELEKRALLATTVRGQPWYGEDEPLVNHEINNSTVEGQFLYHLARRIENSDDCDLCDEYESCRADGQRQCQYPAF